MPLAVRFSAMIRKFGFSSCERNQRHQWLPGSFAAGDL